MNKRKQREKKNGCHGYAKPGGRCESRCCTLYDLWPTWAVCENTRIWAYSCIFIAPGIFNEDEGVEMLQAHFNQTNPCIVVNRLFQMMVYDLIECFLCFSGSNLSIKWSQILRTVICSWWPFWIKPCAEDPFLTVSLLLLLNSFLCATQFHFYKPTSLFIYSFLYTFKQITINELDSPWHQQWLE